MTRTVEPPALSPAIEPLFDAHALREGVADLGRSIEREIGDEDPLLLALLDGSVILLADLVRTFERPVRFGLIHVGYTSAGNTEEVETEGGLLQIHYPLPVEIEGQSVVVLKDVVSSGVTEPYLAQQLRDHGARSVRFAALIDLPDERKTDFELDYCVFQSRRRGVLVGYGLKQAGRYGHLPYLGLIAAEETEEEA
jgi:hypoxanthine phosphoribosyltransferase